MDKDGTCTEDAEYLISYSCYMVRECVRSDNTRASASVFSRVNMYKQSCNGLVTFACFKRIYMQVFQALHYW